MRHLDPGGHLGRRHHGLMIGRQLLVGLVQHETQEKSFGQHRGGMVTEAYVSNVCPATLLIGNSQEILLARANLGFPPFQDRPG
jgi:hypothetical protein